jgi:hypothetical protein
VKRSVRRTNDFAAFTLDQDVEVTDQGKSATMQAIIDLALNSLVSFHRSRPATRVDAGNIIKACLASGIEGTNRDKSDFNMRKTVPSDPSRF